jgi:hypothetical protein
VVVIDQPPREKWLPALGVMPVIPELPRIEPVPAPARRRR